MVVTGVGLVCPVGVGTEETWRALRDGKNGIETITLFDASDFSCRIAGEVTNFDPLDFVERKELKKMGRFIFFAIAGAEFALKASELQITPDLAERVGVYIGSGIGGFDVIEREHRNLLNGGPRRISPFFIPGSIVNLASGQVSIRSGAKGPNSATATACTTGAHAVGDSFRIISRGDADVMICGGAEAAITPMGIGGFASMRALSRRNDDPQHASRPWDADRDGFVVGEGAGILMLEELEFARRRGGPDPRRAGRVWNERRRISHHLASRQRGRRLPGDEKRHSRCRHSARGYFLHQRPWDVHAGRGPCRVQRN